MLGERIKLLRNASKLNQVELGDKLKVAKQTVSNLENENILPSVDMLIKICEFFNVLTDYLLGLDDKTYIEVTGFSMETAAHTQQIINDIRGKKV